MDSQKSLRPYQKDDVKFLTKNPCTGCFNEQRTGKTPTALMTVKERGLEDTRVLVITTSSALYQWKNEYTNWLDKPCIVVDGSPKKKEEAIQNWTHGLIISYGSIKETSTREGYVKDILKKKPTMVILDEAHTIRNPTTWGAKAIFKLTKIPYRLALTGTPAYGEAKDVFSILKFLFPDKFNSAYKFYEEYFKPDTIFIGFGKTKTEYKYFLPGKEKQLQAFMNQYCTQRKRKDVMQWLPEKDKEIIRLPLTTQQKKYLTELKNSYQTEDIVTQGVLDRLIRYRQICLDPGILDLKSKSPKTQWILDFINENPNTPVIIFSNFTQYIQRLAVTFREKNILFSVIVGGVAPKVREEYVRDFQAGKYNVLIVNTMSGKEALTLDRAEAIIFTDVFPPIGAIEQAEDRFVATTEAKKDKPHVIYNLVMADSFDEDIIKLLQERKTETEVINNFRSSLERSSE